MGDNPQDRFEKALAIDPRLDTPNRQGLTGSARSDVYEPGREPGQITLAPDGRPAGAQPQWRKDFAIDTPQDNYVARRDFAKFLVLTSGAFVAGQGWIAAQSLVRRNRPPLPRVRVAALSELAPGAVLTVASLRPTLPPSVPHSHARFAVDTGHSLDRIGTNSSPLT